MTNSSHRTFEETSETVCKGQSAENHGMMFLCNPYAKIKYMQQIGKLSRTDVQKVPTRGTERNLKSEV